MTLVLEVVGVRVEGDSGAQLHVERLVVEGGEVAVVDGATDSGKTLFAAVLCGRVEATGGVSVGGRKVGGGPAARRRQGLAVTVADGDASPGAASMRLFASLGPAAPTPRSPASRSWPGGRRFVPSCCREASNSSCRLRVPGAPTRASSSSTPRQRGLPRTSPSRCASWRVRRRRPAARCSGSTRMRSAPPPMPGGH